MTRVVLQPAGSPSARDHLDKTIWHAVRLDDYVDVIEGTDLAVLRSEFSSGEAPMWGITPGEGGSSARWEPIEPGDVVLFAGQGKIFLRAVVRHKFRNAALARRLWGEDQAGRTWELMYALIDPTKVDLPYADLNRFAGYASNNVVQGTTVLDPERSARVLEGLDIADWHLAPGDTIRRTELHDRYGGSGQSGIAPSRRTPNVLIFADPSSGNPHGYIHDRWVDENLFVYTGEGQSGDQQLTAGNKAIAEHRETGRALRLFYGAGGVVTYAGRFEIDAVTPYEWLMAPPSGGGEPRKVLAFHLRPVGPVVRVASDFDDEWEALQGYLDANRSWQSLGDHLHYEVTDLPDRGIAYTNAGGNAGVVPKARMKGMWDAARADPIAGTGPNTRAAAAPLALLPNIEFTQGPLTLYWVPTPSHPLGTTRERIERPGQVWDAWEYEVLFMRHPPAGQAPEHGDLDPLATRLGRSAEALLVTWKAAHEVLAAGESSLASSKLNEYLSRSGWIEDSE